jgi:hypothetical protein
MKRVIGCVLFNCEIKFLSKAIKKILNLLFSKLKCKCINQDNYLETIFKSGCLKPGKPIITLSFDCDLIEDIKAIPWLMEKLKQYNLFGNFACIGIYIQQFSDYHKLLIKNGHEVVNHTYSHPHHKILNPNKSFNELSDSEIYKELKVTDEIIKKILNVKATGFRSPHFGGLHTKRVYPLLKKLNYKYSSSTLASHTPTLGKPFFKHDVLEIPLCVSPANPLQPFETWGLYRAPVIQFKDEENFLDVFDRLVDLTLKHGSLLNLYFDPVDLKRMGKYSDMLFKKLFELKEEKKISVIRYIELVDIFEVTSSG